MGFSGSTYNGAVFSNLKDPHAVSTHLAQWIETVIRHASGKDLKVSFINEPFPIISKVRAAQGGNTALSFGFLLIIAISIVCARIAR